MIGLVFFCLVCFVVGTWVIPYLQRDIRDLQQRGTARVHRRGRSWDQR